MLHFLEIIWEAFSACFWMDDTGNSRSGRLAKLASRIAVGLFIVICLGLGIWLYFKDKG